MAVVPGRKPQKNGFREIVSKIKRRKRNSGFDPFYAVDRSGKEGTNLHSSWIAFRRCANQQVALTNKVIFHNPSLAGLPCLFLPCYVLQVYLIRVSKEASLSLKSIE